jgi:hypothetical protein
MGKIQLNSAIGTILLAASTLYPAMAADLADLSKLRDEVAALAAPWLIRDADVQVKIAQDVFTRATGVVSSGRTFVFEGVSKAGHVWSAGGGGLGCGGFAEINDGGRAFRFAVTLHSLSATWQQDGRLATKVDLGFNASGNIHGHVHGPAGVCGVSWQYPAGRWSCDCPIGGGAGTNAGFSGQERRVFDGYLAFSPEANGDLSYGLHLTSPSEIPVTVSVGLQHIGNIGIPIRIAVPNGQIAGGRWAGLVQTRGKVRVGANDRPYELALSDLRLSPDTSGLQMSAKAGFKLEAPARLTQSAR